MFHAQVLECFVEKVTGRVVSSVMSAPLSINFALYMDANAEAFPLIALEIADMPHFVTTVFNLFDVEFRVSCLENALVRGLTAALRMHYSGI